MKNIIKVIEVLFNIVFCFAIAVYMPQVTEAEEENNVITQKNILRQKSDFTITTYFQKGVKAAELSKKNIEARKVYKALLEKNKFNSDYNNISYALTDLDNNGIDELFILNNRAAGGAHSELYIFKNGNAKKIVDTERVPLIVYTDGTVEYCMGYQDTFIDIYYKIKNGVVHKPLEMYGSDATFLTESQKKNAESNDGSVYWRSTKIKNRNVSLIDCNEWIENFETKHEELELEYYANTSENRASMLKTR